MKAVLFFLLLALPAFAADQNPKAAWLAWKEREYREFRETLFNNPFALQDVKELAKGEVAFVSLGANPRFPHWEAAKPAGDAAELRFDGERLKLSGGGEEKADFVKGSWKAANGLGISASGIRAGKVKVFLYFLKENKFKPALMPYFPFRAEMVVKAKLDRRQKNPAAKMSTTLGEQRDYPIAGALRFQLFGDEQVLQAYQPEPEKKPRELFIPFKDDTNGKDTYGGGRYVEAELAEGSDEVTIDFNRAYHPYCLYSPHFNCPVVMGNRISGAVKAGAKVPAALKH